jgi:GWxTD domain-containing protein
MIAARGFSVTQDSKFSAKKIITMNLPKSVYKISAEVRDDNQQISYLSQTDTKRLSYLANMPSVIFADSLTKDIIYPDFSSGVAPFPRPITFAILPPDSCAKTISLRLETISGLIIKSDSVSPQKAAMAVVDTNGIISFQAVPSPNRLLYKERFEIDSLTEGNYNIEADFNGKTEKIGFNYLWVDKPFTLKNLDTALSLLKYLVPDSVYAYLNSGGEKERKEKFDEYWKAHDPTPKTAYNEHEAEYYQRADYTVEQFRTISSDNGSATDRGKAYILFGKPGNIRREFRNDGTYEIWSYPNQKKNLFFKEAGPGDFILYRTEDL